jgi:hypothetical protein
MHANESIKKLGAKLAEFAVQHPSLRFTLGDVSDAERLLPYLESCASAEAAVAPHTTALRLSELQAYLDRNVVKNLTKLLEGLISICIPTHLDDVCEKGLDVYTSALAALTRITEQATAAQATAQGKAVARKLLDQLQPENHKDAPGIYALGLSGS